MPLAARPAPTSPHRHAAAAALIVGALFATDCVPAARAADWQIEIGTPRDAVRYNREPGLRILDRHRKLIATAGASYSTPIAVKDLPKHLIDALVASEDRRFYEHDGIDLYAIARAIAKNAEKLRIAEGASTITQQVLKNVYFSDESKLLRKAKEVWNAPRLESRLSKDDILFLYLNRVFFGDNAWGIESASRLYFGKSARQLSILESAVLIGLLPAPNAYSPHKNEKVAYVRALNVIDKMVREGYLDETTAARAKLQPLTIVPRRPPTSGYFRDWVRKEVSELVPPRRGTLVVRTTLDLDTQRRAEGELAGALATHGTRLAIREGAVIVMRPNGEIIAMVGGRDFARSQFNRAVSAKRQPGSAFKPFVYLAALERGLSPESKVSDQPMQAQGVRNYKDEYRGALTLEQALALSSNVAAVRLAQGHLPQIVRSARRLGITAPLQENVGLALGASEVTLIELTASYAALADRGIAPIPHAVLAIEDDHGRKLPITRPKRTQPPLKPIHLSGLRRMLRAVIRDGTGKAADPGVWAAGKTGTTDGHRDAWFVGFTRTLVGGVWLGNDDGTPMQGVTGGGLPAQIWRNVVIGPTDKRAPPPRRVPRQPG